jgi:ribosome-associated protein
MSISPKQFKKIALFAAHQANTKHAKNIVLLDLKKVDTGICDYALVMSGNSEVHLRTLRDAIEEGLEAMQLSPLHKDGTRTGHWIVLDYGGLIVHVFHERIRDLYSIEHLWENAKRITWRKSAKRKQK